MEILSSKRFQSHPQNANGLKQPFGVKNDKYGPCHGADFYKNDTLSRSRNPEYDTLFNGTSPYRKIYEYPPPPGRGGRQGVMGCLDSTLIDKMVLEDAKINKKNLSMVWTDMKKAFDSVAHAWLVKVLEMSGVSRIDHFDN